MDFKHGSDLVRFALGVGVGWSQGRDASEDLGREWVGLQGIRQAVVGFKGGFQECMTSKLDSQGVAGMDKADSGWH